VSRSSVQARLDVSAIENGIVCFGSRNEGECCTVMEIAGSQESLGKVYDAKQEEFAGRVRPVPQLADVPVSIGGTGPPG